MSGGMRLMMLSAGAWTVTSASPRPTADVGRRVRSGQLTGVEVRPAAATEVQAVDAERSPTAPAAVPGYQVPPATPMDQPVRLQGPRALAPVVVDLADPEHLAVPAGRRDFHQHAPH